MVELVSYRKEGGVATLVMDDGKVNALSPAMLDAINLSLDRAVADDATVVLTGREGVFSAGFDLKILREGGPDAVGMLTGGFRLAERVLSFPRPVVMACSGHAIAMGLFLTLSGDYRLGVDGPYKLVANEVAIGLTMPYAAIEICRHRLTPSAFQRAMLLSETFTPGEAVSGGLLDGLTGAGDLAASARRLAETFASLPADSHAATKGRVREELLRSLRAAIDAEFGAAVAAG
jgi:enoyl-CoA hydratase